VKAADALDPGALCDELWTLVKTFKKKWRGEDQMKAMKLIGELKAEHAAS